MVKGELLDAPGPERLADDVRAPMVWTSRSAAVARGVAAPRTLGSRTAAATPPCAARASGNAWSHCLSNDSKA